MSQSQKKLQTTLRPRRDRFLLTCWNCYHEKRAHCANTLAWAIETNLIYFPQTADDSFGIYCCFDCHKFFVRHTKRRGLSTFSYQYTRGDYIKDNQDTWDVTEDRTKAFVIEARAFERKQRKMKAKKRSRAKASRREVQQPPTKIAAPSPAPSTPTAPTESAAASALASAPNASASTSGMSKDQPQPLNLPPPNDQVQPATKAPTPTAPTAPSPAPTTPTAPTESTVVPALASAPNASASTSGVPKPTDRSTYGKNHLYALSNKVQTVRDWVNKVLKSYPGTPPIIKGMASDHILKALDEMDVSIFAVSQHVD